MMKLDIDELKKLSPLPRDKFFKLIGEALEVSQEKILIDYPFVELSQIKYNKLKKILALAEAGTPPEYIFKKAAFCNLDFSVDKRVLIPRPETELLVEQAIKFLLSKIINYKFGKLAVLDLGTGSGCIIISLYKFFASYLSPHTFFFASDISSAALRVARKNARHHKAKINFIQSNLFKNIPRRFDLILANLPYIDPTDKDLDNLHDPRVALVAEKNGFELIEKTVASLNDHLEKKGLAILEIGYNHGERIRELGKRNGFKVKIKKDLAGYDRLALLSYKQG